MVYIGPLVSGCLSPLACLSGWTIVDCITHYDREGYMALTEFVFLYTFDTDEWAGSQFQVNGRFEIVHTVS